MAARIRKTHQDEVRTKIQTSQLLNRLQNHAFGEVDLNATQLRAIEILLRKSLPDLSQVEYVGEGGGPLKHEVVNLTAEEAYKRMLDSGDT